jgi:hypothetical protein
MLNVKGFAKGFAYGVDPNGVDPDLIDLEDP